MVGAALFTAAGRKSGNSWRAPTVSSPRAADSEQPESRTGLGGFQEKYMEKGKNWSQAQQKETSVRAVLRQRRSLLPTKMYLASR